MTFILTKYNDKGVLHRESRFREKESDKQLIHHKNTKHVHKSFS